VGSLSIGLRRNCTLCIAKMEHRFFFFTRWLTVDDLRNIVGKIGSMRTFALLQAKSTHGFSRYEMLLAIWGSILYCESLFPTGQYLPANRAEAGKKIAHSEYDDFCSFPWPTC